jgi:glycosyltransferase involved in cell wall biosynthesis
MGIAHPGGMYPPLPEKANGMKKLLSIITVAYNDRDNLEQTIKGVISQMTPEVEFIIVDGGSTDGTVELVKTFSGHVTTFVSEPDKGIFDAMNKGIKLSTGDWAIFINAGDELVAGALGRIDLSQYEESAVVYGDTIRDGNRADRPFKLKKIESGSMPACHQSMLYNMKVLGKEMYYDTTFPLFGENELLMRVYVRGFKITYLDTAVSKFQGGGISATVSSQVRKARYLFLYKHFGIIGVMKGIGHKLGLIKYSKI